MAWIESHQELARHPKTKKLARLLNLSIPAAIGHLHLFWWWAMDYAPDGDISRFEPEDITDAVDWPANSANEFISSMVKSGFVDEGLMIHDWGEYAGRLIEKREQNKERKRRSRGKQSAVESGHAPVTRPSQEEDDLVRGGHGATQPYTTIPNTTEPNPTQPYPENITEANRERLRKLANTLRLTGLGIDGLETIWSYLGQAETEVIEKAMKKAEGRHVNYFVSVMNGFLEKGMTSKASINHIAKAAANDADQHLPEAFRPNQQGPPSDEPAEPDEELQALLAMTKTGGGKPSG